MASNNSSLPSFSSWQYATPVIYLSLGSSVFVLNIWAIACVVKSKMLARNGFYYLIVMLALSDAIVCANYAILGVWRALYYYAGYVVMFSAIGCYTLQLLFTIGDNMQELAMLAIAIERLYAVALPIHYHNYSRMITCAMLIILNIVSILIGMFGYVAFHTVDNPNRLLSNCVQSLIGDPVFWVFWSTFRNVVFIATIVVYALFLLTWLRRQKLIKSLEKNAAVEEAKRQMLVTIMVSVLVVTYIATTGVGLGISTYLAQNPRLDPYVTLQLAATVASLYLFNYLINVFIFPMKCKELRDAMSSYLPNSCRKPVMVRVGTLPSKSSNV